MYRYIYINGHPLTAFQIDCVRESLIKAFVRYSQMIAATFGSEMQEYPHMRSRKIAAKMLYILDKEEHTYPVDEGNKANDTMCVKFDDGVLPADHFNILFDAMRRFAVQNHENNKAKWIVHLLMGGHVDAMPIDNFFNRDLNGLGLTMRTELALATNKIRTIGNLVERQEEAISSLPHIGKVAMSDISTMLLRLDLHYNMKKEEMARYISNL